MYNFISEKRPELAIKEEDIREVEERFEITFPKILREFYLLYSGSAVKSRTIIIDDEEYYVDGMYYIKDNDVTLAKIIEWDRRDGFIPNTMIPLAYDEGRERYYWNTENENVYFFDGLDLDNPIHVCNSIEEFFEILEEAESYI